MNIKTTYLDRLLVKYAGSYNLYSPFQIGGQTYSAYGYFSSHVEKYVLTREANLWSSDSFEHIIFMEKDVVLEETLKQAYDLIQSHMEPELVRKGNKYPEKNHMHSYLTVIIISNNIMEKELQKYIKKMSFDKGYCFNIRGFSQGRIAVVSTSDEKIYTNYAGKTLSKILKEIFFDLKSNKIGFQKLVDEGKVKPFVQNHTYN